MKLCYDKPIVLYISSNFLIHMILLQCLALFARVRTVYHRLGMTIVRHMTQSGRHDLGSSVVVTVCVLVPLWARPVAGQVVGSATEQLLCQTAGLNLAQLVTIGLSLLSGYYILKFLLRGMYGVDKVGEVPTGRDHSVNTQKKYRFRDLQPRDALYSLVAALLPVLVPAFLNVAGIDVVACLFP